MKISLRRAELTILSLVTAMLFFQAEVRAEPVKVKSSRHYLDIEDTGRTEFDRLIYLSGIKITSDNPDFGGISGLQISPDGARLLAVTDAGNRLRATLTYDGDRLKGLEQVELAPLLDENGKKLAGEKSGDAETVTLTQPGNLDGPAYVSFERRHRVLFYPAGIGSKASAMEMPPHLALAPANKGIEAFERRADGVFIALAEDFPDAEGNHTGWLIGQQKAQPVSLRREGEFQPTDLEFLPDGDLLVLERRYSRIGGPGMQIRRIKADQIKPGAVLDGEVLINLTSRYDIDNFEGITVRQNDAGETIIYLASDNNFSAMQKNLLLMFRLKS